MTRSLTYCIILSLLVSLSQNSLGQRNQQEIPQKTRLLFLLDGSGSMLSPWGRNLRIQEAKKILSNLVDSLRVNTNLELALRVYGHQFDRRLRNCEDSKLLYPFRPNNHDKIIESLKSIKPKGTTPIAYSLMQAANDFPTKDNVRNIIIIITDGIESCGGDPCSVSLELQKKGVFLKPFIIGLGMKKDYTSQFECVGKYFDARDTNAFRNILNKALKQTLDKTTVSIELLNIEGQPKETDVNVTFYNNFTDEPIYEFVHYRDRQGLPDSVTVDAVLSYDIVVNTIPPVVKKNVEIIGGEHNVIKIKSPQGSLRLSQKGFTEYNSEVNSLIYLNRKKEIINLQNVSTVQQYLVGTYDIEVLTLPKSEFKSVRIEQNKTTTINIPAPGLINILSNTKGVGSIYEVKKTGREEWVINLDRQQKNFVFAMQPGNYKLVFRAQNALGSKFTQIRPFTINSGATTNINLVAN